MQRTRRRTRRTNQKRRQRGGRRRRRSRRGGQNWFTKQWNKFVGKKTPTTTENAANPQWNNDDNVVVVSHGKKPTSQNDEDLVVVSHGDRGREPAIKPKLARNLGESALNQALDTASPRPTASQSAAKKKKRPARPLRKADHAPKPPKPTALARERAALRKQLAEHDRRQDAERVGLRVGDPLVQMARRRQFSGGRRFRKRTRRRKRKRRRSRRRRSRRR